MSVTQNEPLMSGKRGLHGFVVSEDQGEIQVELTFDGEMVHTVFALGSEEEAWSIGTRYAFTGDVEEAIVEAESVTGARL